MEPSAALDALFARADLTEPDLDEAIGLLGRASLNDPKRFRALAEQLYDAAARRGYARGVAYGLGYLGHASFLLSENETALHKLRAARFRFQMLHEPVGRAMVLSALASVQTSMGNYEEALTLSLDALKLFRETHSRAQEAWCLQGIGTGYHAFGDAHKGLEYHRQALAIFESLEASEGDLRDDFGHPISLSELRVGRGRALTGIGTALRTLGRQAEAMPYHQQALTLFRENDNHTGEARALNDLGQIHQHLGETAAALACYRHSLGLRETLGNRQAQCTTLIDLGTLYLSQGNRTHAHEVLARALRIADTIKSKPRQFQAHEVLARLAESEGDLKAALHHYKTFHRIKEAVVGEETGAKLRNIQLNFEVDRAERDAEIARLKNVELRQKNEQLETLLDELQNTQQQLVESEKLASLGSLTAGIAHEIKNPLNFINNFARLTVELTEELAEEIATHQDQPLHAIAEVLEELLGNLKLNAIKIEEHGRRADRIVQSMLLHTRGQDGVRAPVALNAFVEEYANLAYHGMRATMPEFNVTIERDYDGDIEMTEVVPQDLGRVLLNLLNNAFYAVHARHTADGDGFRPMVRIGTQAEDEAVTITIWDNGGGIPDAIRARLFEPFFTTKPAGEGTGLGLSISYDIITQGHGGTLEVETTPGDDTRFIIRLPLAHEKDEA